MSVYLSRGLVCREHVLDVPLVHTDPDDTRRIEVYARELRRPDAPDDMPWLVFLQGGPGFAAPRWHPAWLTAATERFAVLMLDQRGTGRSTPMFDKTILALGSPQQQAEYLRHFRADSIVADAEAFRRSLIGDEPWTVLGQSFGGFCAFTYLSNAPEGLAGVAVAGGIPPIGVAPADVYRATYRRVEAANARFFATFPHLRPVVDTLAETLDRHEVRLPTGERLSARRMLTIGLNLGLAGCVDDLHDLFADAFTRSASGPVLSPSFVKEAAHALSSRDRPLYAVLHESIYLEGAVASRWAADTVRAEFAQFDASCSSPLLTGEMTYRWQFAEDPALRQLAATADILADHDVWPLLYNRAQLAANTVPVVAAVYSNDMYVDRDLSLAASRLVAGLDVWETDGFDHDGLNADQVVFDTLLERLDAYRRS